MKKIHRGNISIVLLIITMFLIELVLFLTHTNIMVFDFIFWIIFVTYFIIRVKNGAKLKNEILDLPLLIPLFLIPNKNIVEVLRFIIIISMIFDYFIDAVDDYIIDKKYLLIILSIFTLQFIGGIGFYAFEGLGIIQGQWLTFISATTVGYGDISATTIGGQITTIFIVIGGAVVYGALLLSAILDYVSLKKQREFERTQNNEEEEENIKVVISSFEQFRQGNINLKDLEKNVIKEIAKKDKKLNNN